MREPTTALAFRVETIAVADILSKMDLLRTELLIQNSSQGLTKTLMALESHQVNLTRVLAGLRMELAVAA